MRARAEDLRRDGRRIAVVPTMGALHEGHLTLLRAARARADVVILTIFVNPTQFGPQRGPREVSARRGRRPRQGAHVRHRPRVLPRRRARCIRPGAQTFVEVRELQKPLCGASRPGHFAGVATVVAKLFHVTQPHVAVFGEKDYQQLAIIRRMVRDLDFGIEIVGVPIVREADGARAVVAQRVPVGRAARRGARAVGRARGGRGAREGRRARCRRARRGRARADRGRAAARASTTSSCATPTELDPIARVDRPAVLAMAVFVGTTRLIDNRVLR